MSLVTRLYVGFGLPCLIMALLGGFNLKVLSAFSTKTQQLTSDVFPLDERIQALETLRAQTGILALALVSAESESQLEQELTALTSRVQAMRTELNEINTDTLPTELSAVGEFQMAAQDRLATLETSVAALAELKAGILSVTSAVEAGLESFLASAHPETNKQLIFR
jgi:methyl-accepting chemotaxis protein